jgi:hypothetical protein
MTLTLSKGCVVLKLGNLRLREGVFGAGKKLNPKECMKVGQNAIKRYTLTDTN